MNPDTNISVATMIEIFKTNVEEQDEARSLVMLLAHQFPGRRINFDLQDCDKILRMEGDCFNSANVELLLAENGFDCAVL
jgi:hypothetical protein